MEFGWTIHGFDLFLLPICWCALHETYWMNSKNKTANELSNDGSIIVVEFAQIANHDVIHLTIIFCKYNVIDDNIQILSNQSNGFFFVIINANQAKSIISF